MMDVFSKQKRSWIMSRVRGKDTSPEIFVRSLIHRLGYRFRLHSKDLPGKPDIVFPSRKKVIFVHGCFWHGHDCPRGSRIPKSNQEYWKFKIKKNIARDRQNSVDLKTMGWKSSVFWECELKNEVTLQSQIIDFLDGKKLGG